MPPMPPMLVAIRGMKAAVEVAKDLDDDAMEAEEANVGEDIVFLDCCRRGVGNPILPFCLLWQLSVSLKGNEKGGWRLTSHSA